MDRHHWCEEGLDDFGAAATSASLTSLGEERAGQEGVGATTNIPTQSGSVGAATAEVRKRHRSTSLAADDTHYSLASSVAGSHFVATQKQTESPLFPFFEAAEAEDECAGGDQAGDAAHMAVQAVGPHVTGVSGEGEEDMQKDFTPSATSPKRLAVCAGNGSDTGASVHSVVVYVPTLFTSAAGRPICVRERRAIDERSPYWSLLRLSPERRADPQFCPQSDAEGQHVSECSSAEREPPLKTDSCEDYLGPRSCRNDEASRLQPKPLRSSRVGEVWFQRRARRASSCPERCHSDSSTTSQPEASYALPSFTGFCAANGRPFFMSASTNEGFFPERQFR